MTTDLLALAVRVRNEYSEMPGLQLTLAQACRLLQLDEASCRAVLQHLIDEGVLKRTETGTFIARSPVRSRLA